MTVTVVSSSKSLTSASMTTCSGMSISRIGSSWLSSARLSRRPGMAMPTAIVRSPVEITLPRVAVTFSAFLLSSIKPEITVKGW